MNKVFRRLAATTGLLLILVANAAGADKLVTDVATAAASQTPTADVPAIEVDVPISSSSVSSAHKRASNGEKEVGQIDDTGTFLGQLVAQYFDSFN